MKKLTILVVLMFVCGMVVCFQNINVQPCYALEPEQTTEEQISTNVEEQLNNLDMSSLEQILANLKNGETNFFGTTSFKDKLQKMINGEYTENKSYFSAILNLVFDDLLGFLPLLASIIAIAIICSFISSIRSQSNSKSVADIVHFVCYGVIIVLLSGAVISVIETTKDTISLMSQQMNAVFPIMLTLMTAIGGVSTVGVFQPSVGLLANVITQIFTSFLLPVFIFSMVFAIISNLTNNVKLDKFSSFFSSLFKYSVGFIFTVFSAILAIQGITASTFDGVSIKAAKFAIKSYVPILGGYLSEGMDLILTSSVLIKNAVGGAGLLLLVATIVVPLVKIVVFILALKLCAAVLEPISDSRVSSFVSSVSKNLFMLVVLILGVAFMYFITIGLLMTSVNIM